MFEHGLENWNPPLVRWFPLLQNEDEGVFQKKERKGLLAMVKWSTITKKQEKRERAEGKSLERDIDQVSLSCRIIRLAATSISSEPSKRAALIYRDREPASE